MIDQNTLGIAGGSSDDSEAKESNANIGREVLDVPLTIGVSWLCQRTAER